MGICINYRSAMRPTKVGYEVGARERLEREASALPKGKGSCGSSFCARSLLGNTTARKHERNETMSRLASDTLYLLNQQPYNQGALERPPVSGGGMSLSHYLGCAQGVLRNSDNVSKLYSGRKS